MGIILKHRASQKIVYFLKGADVAILNKVKPGQRSACQEACENLSMEGLRTLVITQKVLSPSAYEHFEHRLHAARTTMDTDRELKIAEVILTIEQDMEYLGVTGVED